MPLTGTHRQTGTFRLYHIAACLEWVPMRYLKQASAVVLATSATVSAQDRVLEREVYVDRLQAMWLAENIANHTGLTTEGTYRNPPFLTDAHWQTNAGSNGTLIDFVLLDPWPADDDTDIEYVYQHLMQQHGPLLTPVHITDGWKLHINDFIWVSNDRARELMDRGVQPPMTGSLVANRFSPRIDAQLTTEFFGALAPGMTATALELADLPIRTTSDGYATHAAQFFVALYSEAATVDRTKAPSDQVLDLITRARAVIPDTSKTADICDYVLTDYLDNPDHDDWERTRDRVYQRYQLLAPDAWHGFPDPDSLGFRYRAWTESSINFATGLIALLYGEGDLRRTIRIGTLSGWDSDNGTATMGGLLGLLLGMDGVTSAFGPAQLSDRYDINRTRDALPPYIPDPDAQDTFSLMAERSAAIIETTILDAGGAVSPDGELWLLPPASLASPTTRLQNRSANLHLRSIGETVTATASVISTPDSIYGRSDPDLFAAGTMADFSGMEPDQGNVERKCFTTQNAGLSPGDPVTLTLEWSAPVTIEAVVFTEDDHFELTAETDEGGWFLDLTLEVRVGSTWMTPATAGSGPVQQPIALDPAIPYQQISWIFETPIPLTGLRTSGGAGGTDAFITATDLDGFMPAPQIPAPTYDLNSDGAITVDDLYAWFDAPVDLTADGIADGSDQAVMEAAARWLESRTIAPMH